jgi:hypothetical protein
LLALAAPAPLYLVLAPTGREVRVLEKTWHRELEVERLTDQLTSDWCDALPADAHDVQRKLIQDPSGERPGLSEHCLYTARAWRTVQRRAEQGPATAAPKWPALVLSGLPEQTLGAERPGKRLEYFEVVLGAPGDPRWTCRLPQPQWQALPLGLSFRLRVDRHGVPNCSSVPLAG